eukprot:gene43488-58903_t
MIVVAPKDLETFLRAILPILSSLMLFRAGLPDRAICGRHHFTAPKVRPRTSCFWLNQPRMTIGAMAMVDAADSLAQNRPCGLEKEAMKAVSGAASVVVSRIVQKDSFQARMMFNSM